MAGNEENAREPLDVYKGLDAKSRAYRARTIALNGLAYRDVKCRTCGRFLGREAVLIGTVEFKCPCKQITDKEFNRVGEGDPEAYEPVFPEGHRIANNTPKPAPSPAVEDVLAARRERHERGA